jgi:hypothetical protein
MKRLNLSATGNMEEQMKRMMSAIFAIVVVGLFAAWTQAEAYSQGPGKEQGKAGTQQQNMFDDDGDGIPNCQDPDYTRPRDGSGKKLGQMHRGAKAGQGMGKGNGSGQGYRGGPRDGSGPAGQLGVCDGTGPKGKGRGRQ